MAKFKIGNYQGIKIDCWTAKDLVGLHHLMKQEADAREAKRMQISRHCPPAHQRPHAHQHASPRNEAGNHQSAEGPWFVPTIETFRKA